MKLLFSILLCTSILHSACKPEKETTVDSQTISSNIDKNKQMAIGSGKPYQAFSPHVQFAPADSQLSREVLSDQLNFIRSSGLPLMSNIFEWSQKNDITKAYDLYYEFITKNNDHKHINLFKQYEGWLITTRLDALSRNDEQSIKFIKTVTTDLITTQYEGYGLLYYALEYLKKYQVSETTLVKTLSTLIVSQDKIKQNIKIDSIDFKELAEKRGKPMPQGIKDMVNSYNKNVSSERIQYIPLIEKLANSN